MTTCTVIHTVAPFRRHRPLLLTLLTAALAVVLAAMLVSGLSEPVADWPLLAIAMALTPD